MVGKKLSLDKIDPRLGKRNTSLTVSKHGTLQERDGGKWVIVDANQNPINPIDSKSQTKVETKVRPRSNYGARGQSAAVMSSTAHDVSFAKRVSIDSLEIMNFEDNANKTANLRFIDSKSKRPLSSKKCSRYRDSLKDSAPLSRNDIDNNFNKVNGFHRRSSNGKQAPAITSLNYPPQTGRFELASQQPLNQSRREKI